MTQDSLEEEHRKLQVKRKSKVTERGREAQGHVLSLGQNVLFAFLFYVHF